jgi:hypothetical protein
MRAKPQQIVPSNCSEGLDFVWSDLISHGYALTEEASIGLPEKFRENFHQTYFNDFTLRHDNGDWPVDRERARDVVRYGWSADKHRLVSLSEHDTITITDRAGIPGKRDHARVMLLEDQQAEDLVRTFLEFVPLERRQPDGTFGVNLFRTFTDVVTVPHHDNEQFIIIYMLDRAGDGAETYLYRPDDVTDEGKPTADPVLRRQLNPGDIIIFEDERFKHGATPIEPPPGGIARRDVLVCTVDNRDTYLAAS